MVTHLVGDDVGPGELAGRAHPAQLVEEAEVQVHALVGRAVERPHRALGHAARRLHRVLEQRQPGGLVLDAGLLGEHHAPGVLGAGEDHADELALLLLGSRARSLRLGLGPGLARRRRVLLSTSAAPVRSAGRRRSPPTMPMAPPPKAMGRPKPPPPRPASSTLSLRRPPCHSMPRNLLTACRLAARPSPASCSRARRRPAVPCVAVLVRLESAPPMTPETAPAPKLSVRRARPTDAPTAAFLLRVAFAEVAALYTPEALAFTLLDTEALRQRMDEGAVWLALLDDRAVGTVSAYSRPEGLHIRSMAVHPDARGHGVGRALLAEAERFGRARRHRPRLPQDDALPAVGHRALLADGLHLRRGRARGTCTGSRSSRWRSPSAATRRPP